MNRMINALPRLGVLTLFAAGLVACDTGEILEVIDPDLVQPENVQGEKGAELFWAGALGEFATAFSGGDGGAGDASGQANYVGMFTDEFHLSGTFPTRNEVDRRNIDEQNGTMETVYRDVHQARVSAENAAVVLEEFLPADSRLGELYNLAGFTYLFFGENYCEGVPYGNAPASGELEEGTPSTKQETFQRALDRFASGRAKAAGSDDQDYLSRVGTARAMLAMGSFASALTEVASVPTDWQYLVHHQGGGDDRIRNEVYDKNWVERRWSVSDSEGGVGTAFRSAVDPRLPIDPDVGIGFDEETPLYKQLKFDSWDSDVPLASGIDARLMEAEAALATGDAATWLQRHNDVRATMSLAPLTDPGNDRDRWLVHFSEHGFWTYATAQRLGMVRRMIVHHGFTEDEVLPNGPFFKGGIYGNDVNFIIPFEERQNPNFDGCLNRNP